MASNLTREEQQNIVALYENGKTKKEIVAATGRSIEAVKNVLRITGLDKKAMEYDIWRVAEYEFGEKTNQYGRRLYDQPEEEQNKWYFKAKEIVASRTKCYRERLMDDIRKEQAVTTQNAETDRFLQLFNNLSHIDRQEILYLLEFKNQYRTGN